MNNYKIIFEDVFSFATTERTTELTDAQYESALKTIESKLIVVNKYDDKTGIHEQLRIKSIELI